MNNLEKKIEKNNDSLLLQSILDGINSAIFLINSNRDLLTYNKAFGEMFNVSYPERNIKCFNSINIQSKKSGIEYFKLRFNEAEQDEESKKCILNMAVNKAINDNIVTENQIVGDEYEADGKIKQLYIKFTVKPISIADNNYTLIIMDDVSDFELAKLDLLKNNMQIKRYNNLYKQELKMARKIQNSILPSKLYMGPNFKIDYRYFPLGELGGDFFDYFRIDEKHTGVLLCDVIGHGAPSALVTTMIKALIESSRKLYLEPEKLTKFINNKIIKIFGDCFLTMIYGVLNNEDSTFNFVRAGHPKPWILKENAVATLGLKDNIMLGVDAKANFEVESTVIELGNKLILFTDGLIDIGNRNSGYEKEIMELISKQGKADSNTILKKIEVNIKNRLSYEKHQDDICVLIIEKIE